MRNFVIPAAGLDTDLLAPNKGAKLSGEQEKNVFGYDVSKKRNAFGRIGSGAVSKSRGKLAARFLLEDELQEGSSLLHRTEDNAKNVDGRFGWDEERSIERGADSGGRMRVAIEETWRTMRSPVTFEEGRDRRSCRLAITAAWPRNGFEMRQPPAMPEFPAAFCGPPRVARYSDLSRDGFSFIRKFLLSV